MIGEYGQVSWLVHFFYSPLPNNQCQSHYACLILLPWLTFSKPCLKGQRDTELAKKKEWSGWDLNCRFSFHRRSLECNKDQRRVLRSWVQLPPYPFFTTRE